MNQRIIQNLEIFKARAAKAGYPFKFIPIIVVDIRGHTAGMTNGKVVRLNKELIVTNEHEIVYETLGHELAHVLQFQYDLFIENGRNRPHGQNFKFLCGILGVNDARCHTMETTPARKTKTFEYKCACDTTVVVGPIVHKRIQTGERVYHCKKCKVTLKEEVK